MIINKILKQLTPKRVKKEIEAIQKTKLPPELQKWVKEYEKVGERDEFIWKWSYQVAQIIIFPNVPQQYHKSLIRTKFFMIMFIVLLDDVADKMQNKKFLHEILKIPFDGKNIKFSQLNRKEKDYLKFTKKVWRSMDAAIRSYPRYKEFKAIIEYDIRQLLNGMNYAYLINKNLYLINEIESQIYLSYNTPATISYMIDLTCSSNFNMKNLGLVREIAWYAQVMTRIANWISTWERELKEGDFTSGVFAYAIKNNIVNIENLKKNREKAIMRKIKKLKPDKYFLKQWEEFYNKISELSKTHKNTNIKQILKTIERLTILHLISRKFI